MNGKESRSEFSTIAKHKKNILFLTHQMINNEKYIYVDEFYFKAYKVFLKFNEYFRKYVTIKNQFKGKPSKFTEQWCIAHTESFLQSLYCKSFSKDGLQPFLLFSCWWTWSSEHPFWEQNLFRLFQICSVNRNLAGGKRVGLSEPPCTFLQIKLLTNIYRLFKLSINCNFLELCDEQLK